MSRSSTSSSEASRATRGRSEWALLVSVVAFLAPVALVAGIFEVILYQRGDTLPLATVVARQAAAPATALYYPAAFDIKHQLAYRRAACRGRRVRVLVLGNSRMRAFRPAMFPGYQDATYNGAIFDGPLDAVAEEFEFVSELSAGQLEIAIIGVDPTWAEVHPPSTVRDNPWSGAISRHLFLLRGVVRAHRLDQDPPPVAGPLIGYKARLNGSGFRYDGSFCLGVGVRTGGDPTDFERVIEAARRGSGVFAPAREWAIDCSAVAAVIGKLTAAGVETHCVLPPFAARVTDALVTRAAAERYLATVRARLVATLSPIATSVLDVPTPAAVGGSDGEMLGIIHGGDVLSARIVAALIRAAPPTSRLGAMDAAAIDRLIERAPTPLSLTIDCAPPASD